MEYSISQFRKFNLNKLSCNSAILIIAKRGSGKSWIVKSLLNHFKDIPVGNIVSLTENVNNFYNNIVPDIFIFDKYSPTIIDNIYTYQTRILKKKKKLKDDGFEEESNKIDSRFFLVLDDCMADSKVLNRDEKLKNLILNGRHYNILIIVTMQYVLNLKPEYRTNFDYIFLLYEDNHISCKKLFEQFGGMLENLKNFLKVFRALTENYGCMVINVKNKKSLKDKIYRYKADDLTNIDFKMGSDEYRDFHNKRYIEHSYN